MKVSPDYYDVIFDFKGEWDMPSSCGLKIRESEGRQYVIVTELYQDNPGTSVTYAGKNLADQICQAKGINPADMVYVECNPNTNSKLSFYDEEYFEVDFEADPQHKYRQLTREELLKLLGKRCLQACCSVLWPSLSRAARPLLPGLIWKGMPMRL
jgi:hypothetical protein